MEQKNTKSMTDEMNPVDVYVGERLRFGRNMRGISQRNVGKAIGVTFQQVQKYERGTNSIRPSRLLELAQLLKVPVTFFFEDLLKTGGSSNDDGYAIPGAGDSGDNTFDMDISLLQSRKSVKLMQAFNSIEDPKTASAVVDLVSAIAREKRIL